MKIIFHNDDFGLTYGFNSGVKDGYLKGITSSTSLRVNGTAFQDALTLIKKDLRGIGVGVHLNLTDGPTILSPLSNSSGKYRYGFIQYLYLLNSQKANYFKKLIAEEFSAQIEMVLNQKIKIDHLDSQDHVHMIPPIFEIAAKMAQKYDIPGIRIVKEPDYSIGKPINLVKHKILNCFADRNIQIADKYKLKYPNAFYGVLDTNNMSSSILKLCFKDAFKRGYENIEVLSHPAKINDPRDIVYTSDFIKQYANLKNRSREAEALVDKKVKKYITRNKVDIINYNDL